MRNSWITLAGCIGVTLVLVATGCGQGAPTAPEAGRTTVPPPPAPTPLASASQPPSAPVAILPGPAPAAGQALAAPPAPPAPKPEPVNLVKNGNFYRWDEGEMAPRYWTIGFGYPADEMPYILERLEGDEYEGGVAVKETWIKNDNTAAFQKVFGQTIEGLLPNTPYRLDIRAHNLSDHSILVSAFEMNGYETGMVGTGTPGERLNLEAALIKPGSGMETYSGTFITKGNGTVKLGARIADEKKPKLPCSVIWDSWTLQEIK